MAIEERRSGGGVADGLTEEWQRAQAEMRALGGAIGDISDELRVLLTRESELASAEMSESASAARGAAMWGGVAAVFGLVATVFLGLTIMYALGTMLDMWAAALITTGIYVLVAAVFGLLAKRRISEFSLVPKRTLRSMQEDVKWARRQIKRNAA